MRYLVIGLAIILLTLLLCTLNFKYVESNLEDLIEGLNKIEENIKTDNWSEASNLSKEYAARWVKRERYYHSVLFHDHVDDVSLAFDQLVQDVDEKSLSDSLRSLITARTILGDIVDMEAFKIENIL